MVKALLPSCGQQPAEPWENEAQEGGRRDGSHCRFPHRGQDTDGRPHLKQVFSLQKQNSFLWNDTESEVQMGTLRALFRFWLLTDKTVGPNQL